MPLLDSVQRVTRKDGLERRFVGSNDRRVTGIGDGKPPSCGSRCGYSLPHTHGVGSQVDGPKKYETTAQERKVRKVVVGGRC